jgi:hypothetical protein
MIFNKNISKYLHPVFEMGLSTVVVFMLLICSVSTQAQNKAISKAVTELQAGNLDSSRVLIDRAAVHEETKYESKTWYYRGFIYKKIYSAKEGGDKQSQLREEALKSFETFFKLDSVSELHESAMKTVKYLSSTLYNDAAGLLNEGKYDAAISNFNRHKSSMKVIDEKYDASSLETQFYLVLGQQYNQLYEQDRINKKAFFDKTRDTYLYVIKLDSNNMSANYNMALLYYNDAVDIIKNLDYDMDLITLELIQDECINLFTWSEPYMLKALELDPCRQATLTGLSGIYFSLNKMEWSKKIQEMLEEVKHPKEYEMYTGTVTEESEINFLPRCTDPLHFIKVVRDEDGKQYQVDNIKYNAEQVVQELFVVKKEGQ